MWLNTSEYVIFCDFKGKNFFFSLWKVLKTSFTLEAWRWPDIRGFILLFFLTSILIPTKACSVHEMNFIYNISTHESMVYEVYKEKLLCSVNMQN